MDKPEIKFEEFEKAILHFKAIVNSKDFIVTGSYVLSLFELIDKSIVSDLDIILVDPSSEAKEMLQRLQESSPAKTKPKENSSLIAIIDYNGIKIDFFEVSSDKMTEPLISLEKFKITTAGHIFRAKKSYNRVKDLIQLRRIASSIMTESNFSNSIDSAFENKNY